jgi:hypothetical protein
MEDGIRNKLKKTGFYKKRAFHYFCLGKTKDDATGETW